jgi:hypothetical protein
MMEVRPRINAGQLQFFRSAIYPHRYKRKGLPVGEAFLLVHPEIITPKYSYLVREIAEAPADRIDSLLNSMVMQPSLIDRDEEYLQQLMELRVRFVSHGDLPLRFSDGLLPHWAIPNEFTVSRDSLPLRIAGSLLRNPSKVLLLELSTKPTTVLNPDWVRALIRTGINDSSNWRGPDLSHAIGWLLWQTCSSYRIS